jgi:hypothetical protein
MLKIKIKKTLLQEGRSKQTYRKDMARAIASFVMKKMKDTPEEILKNGVHTYDFSEILKDVPSVPKPNRLGQLKIIVLEFPSQKADITYKGASYYRVGSVPRQDSLPRDASDIELIGKQGLQPVVFTLNGGDMSMRFAIKNSEIRIIPSKIYETVRSTAYHELKHFVDDMMGELQLYTNPEQNQTRAKQLSDRIKRSYLSRNEIRAYSEQILDDSRQNKKPFIVNLKNKADNFVLDFKDKYDSREEQSYIVKAFLIWQYKILEYAKSKFNRFNQTIKDETGKARPNQETADFNSRKVQLEKEIRRLVPSYFGD